METERAVAETFISVGADEMVSRKVTSPTKTTSTDFASSRRSARASVVTQLVKSLPAMQETLV